MKIASRYPGTLIIDITLPILMTLIPILWGNTLSSQEGAQPFVTNTGTPQYGLYMLIGSNVFFMVRSTLWNIGFWIQREQRSGTLETLYLAPISRFWLLSGIFLYTMTRSLLVFGISFGIGCLLFHINPLQGNLVLAISFLLIGIIPLQGISLAYGALVLRFKEAYALLQMAQWIMGLLMGLYFPLTMLPPLLYGVALIFPPTWVNNGVRAALLEVHWIFHDWYLDLLVLGCFSVITPYLGYRVFCYTEGWLRHREGVGLL